MPSPEHPALPVLRAALRVEEDRLRLRLPGYAGTLGDHAENLRRIIAALEEGAETWETVSGTVYDVRTGAVVGGPLPLPGGSVSGAGF